MPDLSTHRLLKSHKTHERDDLLGEDLSRKFFDPCLLSSPTARRQSRLDAGLVQKGLAVPSIFCGHLRQQQPRKSPFFVRNVTNAPAGWRRASSKSFSLSTGGRPPSTDSIDVRASFRSCRRCSSLSTVNEHQVADVYDEARPLSDDENCVSLVNRVSGGDDSAGDGEVPENQRDVTFPFALGGDPLDEDRKSENDLPCETEDEPGAIEGHASSFTR